MAATVYGESSAVYMNVMTEELEHEMFAIATVHQKNKKAYGSTSQKANEFRHMSPSQINLSPFKLAANAAVINALFEGKDWSNEATMWDGEEQVLFDTDNTHTYLGKRRIELHMNTMGWKI